jgi:succinate dehydrogenase / fumarate reductase cytochrome b subunit
MSLTGAFLILFVTFHALMNGVALLCPPAYNMVCQFLGANWYALVGTLVLAAGCLLHIAYAIWLTLQNRKARGNERYDVNARQPQVEWSSKNMLVLGIVVVAFFIVHLTQFWAKMQLAEISGHEYVTAAGESVPAAAGTWFLQIAFSQPWTLVVYLIGFVALWFHMTHGFWSMMQTVGWNNKVWMNRWKCIGNTWATIVMGLFALEAVVFTVQANRGAYTECPVLQQQYGEMAAENDPFFGEGPCEGRPFDGPEGRPCEGRPCEGRPCEGRPCEECPEERPCEPGCEAEGCHGDCQCGHCAQAPENVNDTNE